MGIATRLPPTRLPHRPSLRRPLPMRYLPVVSAKEQAIRAIQELPDDADLQTVCQKLDFIPAVDEGLAQARSGKTLSPEEVRRRLAKWLST